MTTERLLPTLMLLLQVLAALPYWAHGDWRMGGYWLSAAMLTFCVTW